MSNRNRNAFLNSSLGFLMLAFAPALVRGQSAFTYSFNDGNLPLGTTYTNYQAGGGVTNAGGFTNSGCLVLTRPPGNGNNSYSKWAITNDLATGGPVNSFNASFKLYMGNGGGIGNAGVPHAGGNGLVFHLGAVPPSQYTGSATSWGNGLDITFRTYNSAPNSPGANLEYNTTSNPGGVTPFAKNSFLGFFNTNGALDNFSEAVNVFLGLTNGALTVICSNSLIGNVVVYTNLAIPGYTGITPGCVTFTASEGGATEDAWIDEVNITMNPGPTNAPVGINAQPVSVAVPENVLATFNVGVTGTPPISLEWMSNGVPIPGANSVSYTTPLTSLAMNGTIYSVAVSNSPGGVPTGVISSNAVLTVYQVTNVAGLAIFTDNLVNNFQDGSSGSHSFSNTNPVHSGAYSISSGSLSTDKISFYNAYGSFNSSPYTNVTFWLNGGSSGGQRVQVSASVGGVTQNQHLLPALAANTWQQFVIPLGSLNAANKTNFSGVAFQLNTSGPLSTFYLDDITLSGGPSPALVHLNVNTAQPLRAIDARMFGVNTATWDSSLNTPQTTSLLNEMGCTAMRFPGGSTADTYHWSPGSVNNFANVATNIGAVAISTVNYGSGTPSEAAGWVSFCNVTNNYAFKYWEVGNECYGGWETDYNTNAPLNAHDPWSYAARFTDYLVQMKAADPSAKVGIVVVPGETSWGNGYTNHPATNSRTAQIVFGWTPVVLATLKNAGITPDFAVDHRYPVDSSANSVNCKNSDPLGLQCSTVWTSEAAGLRQMISDYFGAGGANIELLMTENNADAGSQSKQSVSLVNALYYVDSISQLMLTEFKSFVWWDLRNSTDNGGSKDPTLYGWRLWGDLGMINGSMRYPTFYGAKMMQYLAHPRDTILRVSSDYILLSAYAAQHADGALSLLVINKDVGSAFNAQIGLGGFSPSPAATLYSYGIPQDTAAETGIGSQDIATNLFSAAASSFNYSFPPLSLTVFTFAPSAPSLMIMPPAPPAGPLTLQLQGQPGTYEIQTSTNLIGWTPAADLTLTGTSTNFIPATPSAACQFWRAVWQP